MTCTPVHISNSWWLYQCAYIRPAVVWRAHRCTSAGRLTSVCNGLINTRHPEPRWSVICLSLDCRHLPVASDRLGCVASVGTAAGTSRRPLDWSAEVENSGAVLSLLHLCLWHALVQYVLYLLFVACPGTICLVLIVSFRRVISSLFWKCFTVGSVYCSILQFTVRVKSFVHFTA